MKRDRQLRVWDGKSMYNVLQASFNHQGIFAVQADAGNTAIGIIEPVAVMDSTGKKDKTGKIIFEGDICLVDWKDERYKPVVVEITWDEKRATFCFGAGDVSEVGWSHEVIGNIYENPELRPDKI